MSVVKGGSRNNCQKYVHLDSQHQIIGKQQHEVKLHGRK